MAKQLIKGPGLGTSEWREDFNLTQTDGVTPQFKVAAATGNTTIAGTLAVTGAITASAGITGPASGTVEYRLTSQLTSTATGTGTSAQILQTYTIPAGTATTAGQGFRIQAWGTTAANANNKTMSLTFGATTVATTGALAANAANWVLFADVFLTSATAQTAVGQTQSGTSVQAASTSTPAETMANAITITMTGTDGTSSAGDITCTGMIVEFLS